MHYIIHVFYFSFVCVCSLYTERYEIRAQALSQHSLLKNKSKMFFNMCPETLSFRDPRHRQTG
jgi:hypothetical protein